MFGFKHTEKSLEEIVVEHMKKKYNDEFEIISTEYAGFAHSNDVFYMKCNKLPNQPILVSHYKDGIIRDNYASYYYLDQHREIIKEIMEGILGECLVYNDPTMNDSELGLCNSINEYMKHKSADLSTTVVIKNDKSIDFDELVMKCEKVLKERQILQRMLRIYVLRDNEVYKELQNKHYTELKASIDDLYIKEYYMAFTDGFKLRTKEEYTY